MHWRFSSLLSLSILLLCQVTAALPLTVSAAGEDVYTGLDILFIIDQSGSMGGETAGCSDHPNPNDPLGLRFYATQYAMAWMGSDRLQVHDTVTFRMAAVHFGSRTEIQVFPSASGTGHWQEIAPGSVEEWTPLYEELENELEPGQFATTNLGNTNHLRAFEAAREVFDELPEDDSNRRRAIIVLTDGQPYVAGGGFSVAGHLRAVQTFVQNHFPCPDFLIYTVAMNDSRDNYWPRTQEYWQTITHDQANKVTNNDDVGNRFREILLELTEDFPTEHHVEDRDVVPGEVIVPPYLESIAFTFFMSGWGERPVVTVNGEELDPDRDDDVDSEGFGGPIQTIRVRAPEPGRWFVAVDPPDTGVDISMRWVVVQGRLDSPLGAQLQYVPLQVQYTILDDKGQPLSEYSESTYRLFVTAEIKAGRNTWPIELESQPGNSYLSEFTPVETGLHTIHVRAESQDIAGNPVIVYDDVLGDGFVVEPAHLAIQNLPASWPQYKPITLTYELQDSRGRPVVGTPVLEAEVTVTAEGETNTLALTSQPDGTYVAVYEPQKTGEHIVTVAAQTTDTSGNTYTVAEEESGRFDVTPTRLVSLRIVEPKELRQPATGLLPWARRPLLLEAQVVDDTGTAVDASDVFAGRPGDALTVRVLDADHNDHSEMLALALTDAPGLYRAETKELGIGEYELTVRAEATLLEGFLYSQDQATVRVWRVRHPAHVPIAAGFVGLLALTALAVMTRRRHVQRISAHPVTGELFIVNEYGDTRFRQRLDGFQRNHLIFKEKSLDPTTHVTRLEVTCESEQAHKAGRVMVRAYLDGEKQPTLERFLQPRGEAKLGRYRFWLLKDPDDEQFRDRSQDMII